MQVTFAKVTCDLQLATCNDSMLKRTTIFHFIFLSLLVMAFYAVSDPLNLPHDHALDGADWFGGAICHRITDRSFAINGRQFPLCARCTGMYLGISLAFMVLFVAGRSRWSQLPPLPILLTLVGLIGIMGVDGLNSFAHALPQVPDLYEPRNWLRLVTGIGTGLAMGLFAFPILAQTLWRNDEVRPIVGSWREFGLLVGVAFTAVILLLSNQPTINYVMALISGAGVLLIVTALNAILWMTLLRKDGKARRWRETAVPLSISLLLAIGELSIISFLRLQYFGTITGIPGF